MLHLQHITLAVDLDQEGPTATTSACLELAVGLAQRYEAKISLVHVIDVPPALQAQMVSPEESAPRSRYEDVQKWMSQLEQRCRREGVPGVEVRILFGRPWLVLVRRSLHKRTDLLLAGPAKRGPVLESLFGSTTLKLLRKAECPVWVSRGEATTGPVVVAHDLTEVGARALRWGATLAALENRELHILHVLESVHRAAVFGMHDEDQLQQLQESAEQQIQTELKSLPEVLPEVRISLKRGAPQVEIAGYLKEHSAALLVMGTVARSGLSGIVTGNTAETLLPWVRCSLIALKPTGFTSPIERE